jgi:hypothetical protein
MTEDIFKLVHEKTMNFLSEFEAEIKVKELNFSKIVHLHVALILSSIIAHIPNDENKGKAVDEMFKAILAETNNLLLSVKTNPPAEVKVEGTIQ